MTGWLYVMSGIILALLTIALWLVRQNLRGLTVDYGAGTVYRKGSVTNLVNGVALASHFFFKVSHIILQQQD